ncbi:MAG: hypothetical protein J2P16_01015 [Mycobacterium sp.]|nr:hypothetical protein [Mycobacterium sp.]
MTTSTIVWIVVAVVVAVLVIAAIIALGARDRRRRREAEANRIRQGVIEDAATVKRREALGEETAAKARAAQAEAEVKAAEASRLQERAAGHQSEAATGRDQVNAQLQHADHLDPRGRQAEDRGQHEAPHPGSYQSEGGQTPETSYEATENRPAPRHEAT